MTIHQGSNRNRRHHGRGGVVCGPLTMRNAASIMIGGWYFLRIPQA